MSRALARILALAALLSACSPSAIPDKILVLTFDDGVRSHFTVARPLLEKYGFGATFFITRAFSFETNKTHYMTWSEIRQLHDAGFEIGNHTGNHASVANTGAAELGGEMRKIDELCERNGIPRPVSFAWPGNLISEEGMEALQRSSVRFGRRGARPEFPPESDKGPVYDPAVDHPLLIPSTSIPGPDTSLQDLIDAAGEARDGRIAVIQFHGVPEGEHPKVSTSREVFEAFLLHLHEENYTVIAVRDLDPFIDRTGLPEDPLAIIRKRME